MESAGVKAKVVDDVLDRAKVTSRTYIYTILDPPALSIDNT